MLPNITSFYYVLYSHHNTILPMSHNDYCGPVKNQQEMTFLICQVCRKIPELEWELGGK